MDESELLNKYHSAVKLILKSRHAELQNVVINLCETIDKYRSAIDVTKEIIEKIDKSAIELLERKRKRQKWVDVGIGILIGVIGSVISAPIISYLFP